MAGQIVNQKNLIFNKEDTELKDKVNMLEAVVQKTFLNIIELEGEVNELKTKTKNISKETDVKENILPRKANKEEVVYSEPFSGVDKRDMNKSNHDFKCDMCEFSCKKMNMLNKHMNSKHNDHMCTICHKVFPNSMDALMHTAKDHTKKIIEEFPKINSDIVKDAIKSDNTEHLDKSTKFKCAECK